MACVTKRRKRYVLDFYDCESKRQRQTMPKGTTLQKAKEALREIEDRIAKGGYIPDKRIPIFSKVAEDWLESMKPDLRQSTWSVYVGHTKNHFDEFKSLKINRIKTKTIEKYIMSRQNEGMHILTLRKILVSLGQILSYAVRHEYIDHNPLRNAKRPKGTGREEKSKIRILTPSEINALLCAVKNPRYKTLFMLAIMSGARQGELLGLKWSDVDWINSQIHIQRTFNHQAFYDVKTRESNRKIDLGPTMMAELKKWKIACSPNKLDLIFPNEAGQPINYSNMVNRYFKTTLDNAKIDIIRFHDLRHAYASLLIDQGENIKYIQKQLGHSSPTVTLNVYAHLMKPVNQEAVCRLENTIFEGNGRKMVTGG